MHTFARRGFTTETEPMRKQQEVIQRDVPQSMKPLAVSVKTACKLLEIGSTKMWELIKEGRVRTTVLGRKRLVIYGSLEQLLKP
jgi:excisionase family DNA binding protein